MDKKLYRSRSWLWAAASALVFAAVLWVVLLAIRDAGSAADAQGLRLARESLQRAVLECYAAEGVYPESYEYLKEHYAVRLDERRYVVHYEVFASNLMPSITVTERGAQS